MGLLYLETPPPLSGAGLQQERPLRAGEGLQGPGYKGVAPAHGSLCHRNAGSGPDPP